MLGELTGKHEADSSLDLSRGKSGLLVVGGELSGFGGNALEDIVNEGVHDGHSLLGDTGIGVDLLEDLVDVGGVRLDSLLLLLGGGGLGGGLLGRGGLLGGLLGGCLGHFDSVLKTCRLVLWEVGGSVRNDASCCIPKTQDRIEHPTQFPLLLLRRFLESSGAGASQLLDRLHVVQRRTIDLRRFNTKSTLDQSGALWMKSDRVRRTLRHAENGAGPEFTGTRTNCSASLFHVSQNQNSNKFVQLFSTIQ